MVGAELVPFCEAQFKSSCGEMFDPDHGWIESTIIVTFGVLCQLDVRAGEELLREINMEASMSSSESVQVGMLEDTRLFPVGLLDIVDGQPAEFTMVQSIEALSTGDSCACVYLPWSDMFNPGDGWHEFALMVDVFVVLEFQENLTGFHILFTEFVFDVEIFTVVGFVDVSRECNTAVVTVLDIVSSSFQILLRGFPDIIAMVITCHFGGCN